MMLDFDSYDSIFFNLDQENKLDLLFPPNFNVIFVHVI